AHLCGEFDLARDRYEQSLALYRKLGDERGIAITLNNMGDVASAVGNHEAARQQYQEALTLFQSLGDRRCIAYSLEGLAGVALTGGNAERAAWLFGAAAVLRESIGAPLPIAEKAERDRQVAEARASVPPETFEAAWGAGH